MNAVPLDIGALRGLLERLSDAPLEPVPVLDPLHPKDVAIAKSALGEDQT